MSDELQKDKRRRKGVIW